MTMKIDGEDYEVSPKVWEVFDLWYGDKSYRHADFVESMEWAVRKQVVAELQAKAAKDWPGIGNFLADLIHVVRGRERG